MPNDLCEVVELAKPATPRPASLRPGVLHHYEAIALASSEMRAAAQAANWIEVARHEERCGVLIAALKAAARFSNATLNAMEDERRVQLLRQILNDDAQIRGCSEPWIEPITAYISTARSR